MPTCQITRISQQVGRELLLEPTFGWVDCAAGNCSALKELWKVTEPITLVAGGKLAVAGATKGAAEYGPVAVMTGVMHLAREALTGLAVDLDIAGAEELEQILIQDFVESSEAVEKALESIH